MSAYNNWYEEKQSAYVYANLAEYETNIIHKKLFMDLHAAAEKQASLWEKNLRESGDLQTLKYKPNLRVRFICLLAKFLGTERIKRILSAMKIRGMSVYLNKHNEHLHTTLSSTSNLRAAVFGVNDGLISNVSLILGVAGAQSDYRAVLLAGIAGLLAGASSMAAGEYISVRAQREVFEYQIAIEQQELEEYPEEETEELSLIYQARGIPKDDAERTAKFMIENPERGLDTLAREELGIDPQELVSPYGAMISSFISFAIGASIPLLPFLFGNQPNNLKISIGLTAITLFLIGAILSLFTNRNPFYSGMRMLLVGSIAGGITYAVGVIIGITVF